MGELHRSEMRADVRAAAAEALVRARVQYEAALFADEAAEREALSTGGVGAWAKAHAAKGRALMAAQDLISVHTLIATMDRPPVTRA